MQLINRRNFLQHGASHRYPLPQLHELQHAFGVNRVGFGRGGKDFLEARELEVVDGVQPPSLCEHLAVQRPGVAAKPFHGDADLSMMCVFMFAYPGKKIANPGGRVGAIEFLDRRAILPANGNPMTLAANINGNVELCLHERPLSVQCGKTKSSARLAYSRATLTGIIPSGVTDDADDGGGISG